MCVCIYIYIYTYIHTHTHTHTCTPSLSLIITLTWDLCHAHTLITCRHINFHMFHAHNATHSPRAVRAQKKKMTYILAAGKQLIHALLTSTRGRLVRRHQNLLETIPDVYTFFFFASSY